MARTLSPEDYQELGKTYYKLKQYQKAIEAFTSGIDAAVTPKVSLYDYRAASYEKLADFNAAVKDGREAIRLNKRDVKGYLRTGSVLQKMNKLDTAVNIYKYGMKNVSIENKDFQLLQQLHDRLTRKLSPARAVDPFTILPVELVAMILKYLPFKNVVNCLRVSKGWKSYLTKRPNLWTDLDLSGATKPVSRVFIRNACRYAEHAITRLTVHRFQHTDVLRNIATICKNLRELEVLSLPLMLSDTLIEVAQCALNLKKFVIRTDITLDTATQIIRRRPTLEHVEFTSITMGDADAEWKVPLPHLQTIVLHGPARQSWTRGLSLDQLLSQAPTLQSFAMVNWGAFFSFPSPATEFSHTTITSLILRDVGIRAFPRLPSTLQCLVLQPSKPLPLPRGPDPTPMPGANVSWTNVLLSFLPNLTQLTLREMLDLTPEFLEALLDVYEDANGNIKRINENQRKSLQFLSLSGQFAFTPSPATLFGAEGLLNSTRILSPALTSLSLAGMPCSDDDIEALLLHPTRLNSIDISSTQITGASLQMLADGVPTLRALRADNCRISSGDAMVYAQSKGIAVSCRSDAFVGGGRKVRYG